MSNFAPFAALMVASIAFLIMYETPRKKKKEPYIEQTIMARPTYKPTLTPRSDPYANSGVIRGTVPPELGQTAIRQYPLTPDVLSNPLPPQQHELANQYNIPRHSYFPSYEDKTSIELIKKQETQKQETQKQIKKIKNAPIENEYFSEKIKISSIHNNKSSMSQINPFDLNANDFARAGVPETNASNQSSRPNLEYTGAQLPKLGIDNKFKDPTDPTNYMYDRTLFAPLKR